MSDSRLQIKNNKNRNIIFFLNHLYIEKKQLFNKLKYCEKFMNLRDKEVLKDLLKRQIKGNSKIFKEARSKLVIC